MSSTSARSKSGAASDDLLWVDHSGQAGGGQLGLKRFLMQTRWDSRHVVFLEEGPLASALSSDGAQVKVLGPRTSKWGVLTRWTRLATVLADRNIPDRVIANSMKAATVLAFSRKRRKSFVLYLRDDLNRERMSFARWFFLARVVLPRFDGYVSNSEWTKSTIPPGLRSRPSVVAYPVSGVDISVNESVRSNGRSGELRVLSLSRLAHWKGVHVLLDALLILQQTNRLAGISATIAGSTTFEDENYDSLLRRKAELLGTAVSFTGHLEDVRAALNSHDVLVSCSLTPEPFGQVVAQGMGAGLAVVATAQGGPLEMITDGMTGILVPPGDANALAAQLAALADDATLRSSLGSAAALASHQFSDARTVPGLEDALEEVFSRL